MNTTVELDWAYLSKLADKVAHNIASGWAIVERDDVKQEILTHAYECRSTIEKHYDREDFLWKLFKKAGVQYASRERDYRDLLDDQYYYTPDEAKQALQSFLYTDEELGELLGRRDDLLRCDITDALMSARMDAQAAIKRLSERQQSLLMRRYVYGLPISNNADEVALSRAVVALARQMNRVLRTK
ncbi:hypothetical protein [Streptomyces noursei]|uniref:hypothetical protein n=1 Tax=Streptomyces noursei TaxID=1971 RepID=UPI001671DED1|nr:hypothetical protein [Streptomyces noursei]MCZ1015587.1 hypothetical protein [Streptomyces noursei]GGW89291.1 hypothetical protein GCM10010341_07590 [Streptomyces noursei]